MLWKFSAKNCLFALKSSQHGKTFFYPSWVEYKLERTIRSKLLHLRRKKVKENSQKRVFFYLPNSPGTMITILAFFEAKGTKGCVCECVCTCVFRYARALCVHHPVTNHTRLCMSKPGSVIVRNKLSVTKEEK